MSSVGNLVRPQVVALTELVSRRAALAGGTMNVAIIGPASLTRKVVATISKGVADGTDSLPEGTNIDTSLPILVSQTDRTTGIVTTFTITTDFTIDTIGGNIDWSPAGTEPATGSDYDISYSVTKTVGAGDFDPKDIFSESEGADIYGPKLSNGIVSELSVAISKAFREVRVSRLTCVQTEGVTDTNFTDAITKLQTKDVQIICPLSDSAVVASFLKTHTETLSTALEKKERVGFISSNANDTATIQTLLAQPTALASENIRLVATDTVPSLRLLDETTKKDVVFTGTTPAPSSVPISCFVATQAGSLKGNPSIDPATPLTARNVPGFEWNVDPRFLRVQVNTMIEDGLFVVEKEGTATATVVRGITTDNTDIQKYEDSLVTVRHEISRRFRRRFKKFIGGKLVPQSLLARLNTDIIDELSNAINDELISSFDPASLSVQINTGDATRIDIAVDITPVGPLNFIVGKLRFAFPSIQ